MAMPIVKTAAMKIQVFAVSFAFNSIASRFNSNFFFR